MVFQIYISFTFHFKNKAENSKWNLNWHYNRKLHTFLDFQVNKKTQKSVEHDQHY